MTVTQQKARSRCARWRAVLNPGVGFVTYFAAPDTAANTLCA
jgi:hypothetical protein